MKKTSFSAVIFDMDGLLMNTEFYVLNAFTNVCTQMGLTVDIRILHKCIGTNQNETNRILERELKGAGDIPTFRLHWESEYRKLTAEKDSLLKEGFTKFRLRLRQPKAAILRLDRQDQRLH